MFKATSKQRGLFGASSGLDARVRVRLEKSWAEGFQKEVLPVLLEKEEEFAALYSSTGRPNWSVARMLGLLILRELLGIRSDRELSEGFAFDLRFQHALDVSEAEERVISERSIASFRARLAAGDPEGRLLESVFAALSQSCIRRLRLSTKEQRTDSTFIRSNMERRNRAALLQEVLRTFLAELGRGERLGEVSEELRVWLDGLSGWDAPGTKDLHRLGDWLDELVRQFANDENVSATEAYQTMSTVLKEHFVVDDETDPSEEEAASDEPPPTSPSGPPSSSVRRKGRRKPAGRRKRKKKKKKGRAAKRGRLELRAKAVNGLQSPHDLDARKGRKGVGYNFHVTETSGNQGTEILTDFRVVPANRHDSKVLPEVLAGLAERGHVPEVLLADGAYATLDNFDEAKRYDMALCAPVHRGNLAAGDPKMTREDFVFAPDGTVIACPAGHAPQRHAVLSGSATSSPALHVLFDGSECDGCTQLARCPTQGHGRQNERKLCLDPRLRARDALLKQQQEKEWRRRYHRRAGIEASMSEMARSHGVKKLPVRGQPAALRRALFKSMACNAKRLFRKLGLRGGPRHRPQLAPA